MLLKRILLCEILLIFLFIENTGFSSEYVIGQGDILKITVYEHNDLTTVVRVGGSGSIQLPLLGSVHVLNLSLMAATKKIANMYADGYIINPQVHIFIEEFQSQKATILGEVEKPGTYEMQKKTTLLELISEAGGLTADASEKITVKRGQGNGKNDEEVIKIDMVQLVQKGKTSQNIAIHNGDTVYVAKRKEQYVFISGEVKKPDAYEWETGYSNTLIEFITKAGGFSPKAAPSKVKVIRKIEGEKKMLNRVNMDVVIHPGDIIVVPESFF